VATATAAGSSAATNCCAGSPLPGTFPQTKRYAAELTAGTGHDRFDFTIGLMIDGLANR
jgi:hypothetical protein